MATAVAERPAEAKAPAPANNHDGAPPSEDGAADDGPSRHPSLSSGLLPRSGTLARLESALEAARREAQTHRRRSTAFGVAVLLLGAVLVAGHYGDGSTRRAAAANLSQAQQRFEAAVKSAVDHNAVLNRLNVTLGEVAQSLRSALGDDDDDGLRIGQALRARGARPRHPVVVVPGFVTSGLELWEGRPCARSLFRQRLWGTLSMASTLLQNRTCWLDHLSLDPKTGGDPPGIRLRAAKGLEAVDNFMATYWVFSKLFQSLGDVGYDNNFVVAAAYDWRLSLPMLQRRDAYFTRLKAEVELLRAAASGEKVVLVSHSFGGVVTLTFFEWVERAEKGWTERNVHAWANLAAPLLGLPKALAPLISGESRETADLMQGVAFLVESYLSRTRRAGLFRTWGSLQTMLPVGGPKVWGNATHAPDDPPELRAAGRSLGALLMARDDRASAAGRLGASATAAAERAEEQEKAQASQQKKKKRRSLFATRSAAAAQGAEEEDKAGAGSEEDDDVGSNTATTKNDNNSSDSGSAGSGQDAGAPLPPPSSDLVELPLDVDAALRFVGRMAGPNFVANLPKWSAAARRLDIAETLREAQEEAAAHAELLHEHEEEEQERQGASCSWSAAGGGGACGAGGKHNATASAGASSSEEDDDNIDVDRGSGRTPHGNSTRATAVAQAAASLETVTRMINALLGYGNSKDGGDDGGAGGSAGAPGVAGDPATADAAAAAAAAAAADAAADSSASAPRRPPPQKDVLEAAAPPGPPVRAVDSTTTPLPKAPSLRVYCLYGTGAPTERAYHYAREPGGLGRWAIDTSRSDAATSLDSGVQLSDGDGTVPLLSNGALCEGGWRTRRLNPASSRVVVREYANDPVPAWVDPRGGPKASSHVEILGHEGLMEDVLRIATGFEEEEVKDRYHSRIREIAAAIPWKEL